MNAELTKAVQDTVRGILREDEDLFAEALARIIQGGPPDIHKALAAWSQPLVDLMHAKAATCSATDCCDEGFWGFDLTDFETGDPINPEDTSGPHMDVMRIVVATANNDHDMIAAIVISYIQSGPEETINLMGCAASLSASTLRAMYGADGGDPG